MFLEQTPDTNDGRMRRRFQEIIKEEDETIGENNGANRRRYGNQRGGFGDATNVVPIAEGNPDDEDVLSNGSPDKPAGNWIFKV